MLSGSSIRSVRNDTSDISRRSSSLSNSSKRIRHSKLVIFTNTTSCSGSRALCDAIPPVRLCRDSAPSSICWAQLHKPPTQYRRVQQTGPRDWAELFDCYSASHTSALQVHRFLHGNDI